MNDINIIVKTGKSCTEIKVPYHLNNLKARRRVSWELVQREVDGGGGSRIRLPR